MILMKDMIENYYFIIVFFKGRIDDELIFDMRKRKGRVD